MYKLEIFSYNPKRFVAAVMIPDTTPLSYDYLSPTPFILNVAQPIECDILNVCRITDGAAVLWEGYIYAVQQLKGSTELTLAPFLKLLDVLSVQNQTTAANSAWRWQIRLQIFYDFQKSLSATSRPSLYPLPWVYADDNGRYSNWSGVKYTYGPILATDLSCVQLAATVAGKYMGFGIDPETYAPAFWFNKTPDEITIEADLPNVLGKELNVNAGIGTGANIGQLWYPADESGTNYNHHDVFLMADGEIVYSWENSGWQRVNEVVNPRVKSRQLTREIADSTERKNKLLNMVKPAAANNLIRLKYKKSDKLIGPTAIAIGTPAKIKSGGKTYETTLTGWEMNGDTITLIFGAVRNDLTKKIIDLITQEAAQ